MKNPILVVIATLLFSVSSHAMESTIARCGNDKSVLILKKVYLNPGKKINGKNHHLIAELANKKPRSILTHLDMKKMSSDYAKAEGFAHVWKSLSSKSKLTIQMGNDRKNTTQVILDHEGTTHLFHLTCNEVNL